MKLVVVFLLVGIVGLSSAAPHGLATKQEKQAKLESLLGRLIGLGARYFAKQQDGDDATLQDDDDSTTKLQNWRKYLKKGLRFASRWFAKEQDDNDDDDLANLIAKLQDDDDDEEEESPKMQNWRKYLKKGLRFASRWFAKEQDDDDDDDLAKLIAKLQDDDGDLEGVLTKLQDDNDGDSDQATIEDLLADLQDADDGDDQASIEDLLAELQDDGNGDSVANKENIFGHFFHKHGKSLLKHGLHFLAKEYGKTQDIDDGDDLEDLIAKLQGSTKKKSLAEQLLEKLTSEE